MEEMDTKEKLLNILFKNFNFEGLANDIIDEVLEEALKKVVADSENSFDDMLMAAVYPTLEKELKEQIKKLLEKIK